MFHVFWFERMEFILKNVVKCKFYKDFFKILRLTMIIKQTQFQAIRPINGTSGHQPINGNVVFRNWVK